LVNSKREHPPPSEDHSTGSSAKRPKSESETPSTDGTLRCLDLPPEQAKNLLENINPHPRDKLITFREADHKQVYKHPFPLWHPTTLMDDAIVTVVAVSSVAVVFGLACYEPLLRRCRTIDLESQKPTYNTMDPNDDQFVDVVLTDSHSS